jgi:hypothetical protein
MTDAPQASLHPFRSTGTLGLMFMLAGVGMFILSAFVLTWGGSSIAAAGLFLASLALFGLWAREDIVARRARDGAISQPEMRMARIVPAHILLLLLFVGVEMVRVRWGAALDEAGLGMVLTGLSAGVLTGWCAVFILLVRSADEMVRAMMVRATAAAAGGTLFIAVFWAVIARGVGAPEIPALWLFPLFAVVYGIAASVMREGAG